MLVVGAGLAGLALAAALRERGIPVEVIERAHQLHSGGAGLYLVGIGSRALRALGALQAALSEGQVIETQTFFNRRGARLADMDVARYWSGCGPCFGVGRAVLHHALAERAAGTDLRLGLTVESLRQNESGVSVLFSDGSTGVYDFVVGADGIRSSIRRLAFGAAAPRFRGQVGWRFIASCPASISGWTVFLGSDRAFLFVPIGGGRAYCYADQLAAQPLDDPPEGRLERLQARFYDFPDTVGEALERMSSRDQIHYAPIEESPGRPPGRGRVLLIGDAAHAMSPNMACGAAMALEDALVLADILHANGAAPEVIPEFARRRSARVDWVHRQTDKRDHLRTFPSIVRDLSLRFFTSRIYQGNYRPLLAPA